MSAAVSASGSGGLHEELNRGGSLSENLGRMIDGGDRVAICRVGLL